MEILENKLCDKIYPQVFLKTEDDQLTARLFFFGNSPGQIKSFDAHPKMEDGRDCLFLLVQITSQAFEVNHGLIQVPIRVR